MDWKAMVKSVAPVLGTALGGPFGGMATKFLAGALLGDENAPETAVEEFVTSANPDAMVKIKELETSFKLELKRIGLQERDLDRKDRESARQTFGVVMFIPQMVLSTIFVTAFSVILYHTFTQTLTLDEIQKNILMYLLGILSAGLVQVMNFWFGSSSGSKEKTAKFEIK